jgi:hypothetical protein
VISEINFPRVETLERFLYINTCQFSFSNKLGKRRSRQREDHTFYILHMTASEQIVVAPSLAKKYAPKDIREAYASVLYCCVAVDKEVGEEELVLLDNSLLAMAVFNGCDEAEYVAVAEENAMRYSSCEILQESFNYIRKELWPQLFFHCCRILLANAAMSDKEKHMLDKVIELSGTGVATAKKIMEVALLRNLKDE